MIIGSCIGYVYVLNVYLLEKQNIIKEINIVIWCSEKKMNILLLYSMFVFCVNPPVFTESDTSYPEFDRKISKIWPRVIPNNF